MTISYHPDLDLDKLRAFDPKKHKSEEPPDLFNESSESSTKKPTKLDRNSIFQYTSGAIYRQMNHLVRSGSYLGLGQDAETDNKIHSAARQLHSAFSRLRLNSNSVLYRGIRTGDFKDAKPGQVIVNRGFTSTTKDRQVANSAFGGNNKVLMHIVAKKGIPAIDTSGMSDIAEQEVILPAHSHFLIHHVKKQGNSTHIFATWIGSDDERTKNNLTAGKY